MSLRGSFKLRTLCEVLREINDALQGEKIHSEILHLLFEAEDMGKRMSRKLRKYNKDWESDWWEKNKNFESDLKRREGKSYIS